MGLLGKLTGLVEEKGDSLLNYGTGAREANASFEAQRTRGSAPHPNAALPRVNPIIPQSHNLTIS